MIGLLSAQQYQQVLLSFLFLAGWFNSTSGAAALSTSNINSNNMGRSIRPLPPKLLIAYTTDCSDHDSPDRDRDVIQSVRNGINVLIWSFMEIHSSTDEGGSPSQRIEWNSLDLDCIRNIIQRLDDEGYTDTVHLVSFGGWNGPHLDPELSPQAWYDVWKKAGGDVFHGLDWDLEGHDDLHSPTNKFTMECLEKMGQISQLAKQDGYHIGMAPPQSYFDTGNPHFSRSVNLTDSQRQWHSDFSYFGANVYAFLMAKYGDFIDFVSIQFYESYSRAAMNIYNDGIPPVIYLEKYVRDLVGQGNKFLVNFQEGDPQVGLSNQLVTWPLSKLVFGFGNGWTLDLGDKALFVPGKAIETAYVALSNDGIAPRGFMFWVLGEEGTHGIHYARDLNKILKIRPQINGVDPESTNVNKEL